MQAFRLCSPSGIPAAPDVTGGPRGGEIFERELGKVGGSREGTLQMCWFPGGKYYPG